MIVTYVQFPTGGISKGEMRKLFEGSAPKYPSVQGLTRKYYLLSEDGAMAGGVYLWENRADAEAMFNADWFAFIKERYGATPEIKYFESPVQVDNLTGEILVAEGTEEAV